MVTQFQAAGEARFSMSAFQQIWANAAWVADNFGKQSGIEPFAYTDESVAYLDDCLDRQADVVKASEASVNKFVSLLGAYLGECIIAKYGGEWQESPQGLFISIRTGKQCHILQPFHKVYKRIVDGTEDSLGSYFTDFIPRVMAQA
jgi:hypothetical protein